MTQSTYMCSIDIYTKALTQDHSQADRFATQPVILKNLVCITIEGVSVEERLWDSIAREYTDTASHCPTEITRNWALIQYKDVILPV